MLKYVGGILRQFVTSEDGVSQQAILPVAWVGAVLMAAAVVLGMPDKAHADVCWADWGCDNYHAYWCQGECADTSCTGGGWACVRYGSGPYRCKCW